MGRRWRPAARRIHTHTLMHMQPPGKICTFSIRFVSSMRCPCENAKTDSKRTKELYKEAANIHLEVFPTPQESAVTYAIANKKPTIQQRPPQ